MEQCRNELVEHVKKGDPRDVAAYCAFLWHHGEKTAMPMPGANPYRILCSNERTQKEDQWTFNADDQVAEWRVEMCPGETVGVLREKHGSNLRYRRLICTPTEIRGG